MSAKKRLIIIIIGAAMILLMGLMAFNFITDPFGVFNSPFFSWDSYEMTAAPKTAKITYLENCDTEYDSFIIGSIETGNYPVSELNEYFNASFYNMAAYDGNIEDSVWLVEYLAENFQVKNIILNVSLYDIAEYEGTDNGESYEESGGERSLLFYLKYLFSNPVSGLRKIVAMRNDTYLAQDFDIFVESTGERDNRERDASSIQTGAESQATDNEDKEKIKLSSDSVSSAINGISKIKALCDEKGISLTVVCQPLYYSVFESFEFSDIEEFYTQLAAVCSFWDFSYSSLSFDFRYFYDDLSFKTAVGGMVADRIVSGGDLYCPDDFGVYVTEENVKKHLENIASVNEADEGEYTANVPVLMYHHVGYPGDDSTVITPELFEEHIKALSQAGYTSVTMEDLKNYVNYGTALPEKPVVITFDDGYLSNYEYAYPILEKYGMKATIFVIGATVGNTEYYKDTQYPITPHFTWEQGAEMVESGVISLQSHTYDMHQWPDYEESTARENILQLEGESEEDYIEHLTSDCQESRSGIEENCGSEVFAIAYPYGLYSPLAQVVLAENGYEISFTTNPGENTVIKGLGQSLYALNRYTMSQGVSVQQLLDWVSSARG